MREREKLRALAAAVAAAIAAAPERASAGACCASATSFGVGRLLVWEDQAVGVRASQAWSVGQWDATGSLRWNDPGYSDAITTVQPWAIVRLHHRVQVQGWVPIVVEERASAGRRPVAGGLGDVGAALRVELVKHGRYAGAPAVAITAGGLAPTGRRVEETSPPLFAGTTGRGAWAGSLAVEAEYARGRGFVRLDAGVTGYAPFRRPDLGRSQRYGRASQLSLSAGRELVPDVLVLAASVTGEWEEPLRVGGDAVPGSGARSWAAGASLSWRPDSSWTLTASFEDSVWPDGAARNRDARAGFTLGVRRGF
jgi:hypothetical protein